MNSYGTNLNSSSIVGTVMLEEPVDEDNFMLEDHNLVVASGGVGGGGESVDLYNNSNGIYYAATNGILSRNISWEYKNVSLTRVPGYGFGIAVSGGSDNPHFANGDPAIAISDVLKGGPAEGKLQVNDRIITANGIKLENVDYGTAVQVLRDSGPTVNLIIKRRIINQNQKLTLNKLTNTKLKNIQPIDYGVNLQIRIYVKDSKNLNLSEGDEVLCINGVDVGKLFDFKKSFGAGGSGDKLSLTVVRQGQGGHQQHQQQQQQQQIYNHQTQPSYESSNGNLYVQPPTRGKKSFNESLPPPPPVRPPLPKEETTPPPPPPPPNHPHPHNHTQLSQPTKFYTLTQPRYINFIKKNQLGIRLSGGNNIGIYISAVQPDTPADQGGLKRGDRIIRVNDTEYNNTVTREEAIEKLGSLKNETIVSLIVRFVPEFEKILSETEFHDKIYFRIKFDFEEGGIRVGKNSSVVVFDTLSTSNNAFGWEGYLLEGRSGRKLEKVVLPNYKQAVGLMKGKGGVFRGGLRGSFRGVSKEQDPIPYEKITRKKVTWPRPIVIYSNFTDVIYERICKEFPHRFSIVKSTLIEEMHTELRTLMEKGVHGLLQIRSVASYEKLSNTVCPAALIVKTEDKQGLKDILKVGSSNNNKGNYYSTLLRSFNKSTPHTPHHNGSVYKKQSDELQRTEEELGQLGQVIKVNPENWFRNVVEGIESELKVEFVWVNDEGQLNYDYADEQQLKQSSQENGHQDKVDLPNYNLPPPYAVVPSTSNGSFIPLNHHQLNLNQDSSFYNTPTRINNSHSRASESPLSSNKIPTHRRPYSTENLIAQPNSLKRTHKYNNHESTPLLAHSPVQELGQSQGVIPPVVPVPAPQVDRTKKPMFSVVNPGLRQKPVPPPKPTKIVSKKPESDASQSYYLNLPINSKSFVSNSNKSAFELYRKPEGVSSRQQNDYSTQSTYQLPLMQDNTTTGTFDSKGGVLVQRNVPGNQIPIELRIPEGAIPEGSVQTIWFHAVPMSQQQQQQQQQDIINGNHTTSNGILPKETNSFLISPLIKFGPEGLRFSKPVEIRIPQYSKQSNASVLLGNEKSSNWSKINIQQDEETSDIVPFKIVSLTIQQF